MELIDDNVDINGRPFTAHRVKSNMRTINWRLLAKKWNHLKGIAFPITGLIPILDILIGSDYADLHCSIQETK